jgi:aspartate aminotransferase-like enzyme
LDIQSLPDNPYLLLTPGPLSTTKTVKAAMLRDGCTWDDDYHAVVQDIRRRLTALATEADGHTCVLMQGSGTFVHCETTTGMLNPAADIGRMVKQFGKTCILDAMSSFGGIPMDMAAIGADFLISSANPYR